jgi:hypothetical protein
MVKNKKGGKHKHMARKHVNINNFRRKKSEDYWLCDKNLKEGIREIIHLE